MMDEPSTSPTIKKKKEPSLFLQQRRHAEVMEGKKGKKREFKHKKKRMFKRDAPEPLAPPPRRGASSLSQSTTDLDVATPSPTKRRRVQESPSFFTQQEGEYLGREEEEEEEEEIVSVSGPPRKSVV